MNLKKYQQLILAVIIGIVATLFMLCNNPSNFEPNIQISILAVEEVKLRDTVLMEIKIDNGSYDNNMLFCWMEKGCNNIDTLKTIYYKKVWNFPDTGSKKIYGWIVKNGKRYSEVDSISIRVIYFKPEAKLLGNDSIVAYDKVTFKVSASDKDGFIDKYEWIVDNNIVKITNGKEDSLCYMWSQSDTGLHIVKVIAIDNDIFSSSPDSLSIMVTRISPPNLIVISETIVTPRDTVIIIAHSTNSLKKIEEYLWSCDDSGNVWFSTPSDTLKKRFRSIQDKNQTIRSKIVYEDGIISPADSVSIILSVKIPKIRIDSLKNIYAGDTTKISVLVENPDEYLLYYTWNIEKNGESQKILTDSPYVRYAWSTNDTGTKKINLRINDKDSLFYIDTFINVRVILNAPVLIPLPDTIISYLDTLHISRSLVDPAVKSLWYYWDTDGNGWDDTTVIPEYHIRYQGNNSISFVTCVLDEQNRYFFDTTHIYFNLPPIIDTISLHSQDTFWLTEKDSIRSLILRYKIHDPDNDSLRAFFLWGKENLDTFFINSSEEIEVPFDSPGVYRWKLVVKDIFEHTIEDSGYKVIGREHTICFAGHSYCTGDGDTSGSGGFRLGIISSLRDSIGKLERIRAAGPFVSVNLMWKSPADDSCFAISGATAREIQLLFQNAFPELTADIWVVMLGVNGSFDNKEKNSTLDIIKEIFKRNSSARLYFILSPPFSSSTNSARRWFNREIKDTIDSLYNRGYDAFVIYGDSLLSENQEDLKIDPNLTLDGLHPNTEGYKILSDEIVKVMFEKEPYVIPNRKNQPHLSSAER